jgi:hypothetical protein
MRKLHVSFLIAITACFLLIRGVFAQTEQLTLKMSRDWGYGGFHGDIQGLFTMHITGPADLAKVVYYIDDTVIGEVDKAPFNLQFTTDNYPLGIHDLYAVGSSSSGQEYRSNVIKAEFVPASSAGKTIAPVLIVVVVILLISTLAPILMMRRKKQSLPMGAERKYGAAGGAICPKCNRPFALSLMSPNMGFSKLAVCPYCGKVSVLKPLKLEVLRQAEKAELEAETSAVQEQSEEDKLKKEIDDSKYQGF